MDLGQNLRRVRDQVNGSNATQSSILEQVNGIDTSTRGLGEMFLDYIEHSKRWQADLIGAIHQDDTNARDLGLSTGRPATEREQQLRTKLLHHLHFAEMTNRQDRIAEAHKRTFQWIYRDPETGARPWDNFLQWLRDGSTLYWITGKAGSGKSTLMKFIYDDERTIKHLKAWASNVPLVTAAFFFWNSGTNIQMSQMGLYRSILHQTLMKRPTLISRIFPKRWEAYNLFGGDSQPWSEPELQQAFRLLAKEDPAAGKFCFFIDGLDEFDGDHRDLVNLLEDVITSPHIKICVASRPWLVFEDGLKHRPSLMLHHLTYPDIKNFVSSNFNGNAGFVELTKWEPQYANQLLEDIAQKAAGVFLWAHLVVRSLLAGLVNGDRVSDLQKRLDFLPPDLEDLYQKMLNSLDPFYFQHASQLFQIVRAAQEPPTLLCLSFADEEPEFLLQCKVQPLGDDEKILRTDMMRRRLNSRCKGPA